MEENDQRWLRFIAKSDEVFIQDHYYKIASDTRITLRNLKNDGLITITRQYNAERRRVKITAKGRAVATAISL